MSGAVVPIAGPRSSAELASGTSKASNGRMQARRRAVRNIVMWSLPHVETDSIKQCKRGPRDPFEQGPLGLGTGKTANAEQDAEQQSRHILGDEVGPNRPLSLRRFDRA